MRNGVVSYADRYIYIDKGLIVREVMSHSREWLKPDSENGVTIPSVGLVDTSSDGGAHHVISNTSPHWKVSLFLQKNMLFE